MRRRFPFAGGEMQHRENNGWYLQGTIRYFLLKKIFTE